jgi:hypothetical protein
MAAPKRDFPRLRCPECGEGESLHMRVEDAMLLYTSCEAEISRSDAERNIAAWQRLLRWLESASTQIGP